MQKTTEDLESICLSKLKNMQELPDEIIHGTKMVLSCVSLNDPNFSYLSNEESFLS